MVKIATGEYVARSGKGITLFRLDNLFWQMYSGKTGFTDFPLYFQKTYRIDRTESWLVAWALVRAA